MELTTARLQLREFVLEDWEAVLAYQSDPRYLRYYPWSSRTAADVKAFVGMLVAQQARQLRIRFQRAITLRSTGALIGNCGLRMEQPEAHAADLGYEIAPDRWGHGYATEAARAMLRFGFDELRLQRIWANCIADNRASARVLEKLGICLEGRLRANEQFKGRQWDTLIYGILADEWRQSGDASSGVVS